MTDNYLLTTPFAVKLYQEVAQSLPIIDYHNHLCVEDIVSDRLFETVTQLWISADPYKHRAMRILGVAEHYITGSASDFEKFEKWYTCLPRLVGNPLYDWSMMEFSSIFGIRLSPFTAPASQVFEEANRKLKTLSTKTLLAQFHIEYCAPCASLNNTLAPFRELPFCAPSLRGDDIVAVNAAFLEKLNATTGKQITTLQDFRDAIEARLSCFMEAGCRFTDHALDDGFRFVPDDGKNEARFAQLRAGKELDLPDRAALSSYILTMLGQLYAKHNLVMQLHIGAKRSTSTRLRRIAGPAGGYAAIGNCVDVASLTGLLDSIEAAGHLPKTILFTLNPADNAVMSVLSGSYSADGREAVVSQGPAWWWCDHYQGMTDMLEHLSCYGIASTFVGMTTDSRSLLSFVRHDYFRRVLCQWIGTKVSQGVLPEDTALLGDLVKRMCYQNAKNML